MSGIVERLDALANCHGPPESDLLREAAAEIERLRALVEKSYKEGWREGYRESICQWSGTRWSESKARAVLDGK